MKVADLKRLISSMDDSADVLVRGRDCVGKIYWVELIGHKTKETKASQGLQYLSQVDTVSEIYGGEELEGKVKEAICFVESD